MKVINKASRHLNRTAILSGGEKYTYRQLLRDSQILARFLLLNSEDLDEAPVAFMLGREYHYTVTQWAIWQAGGITVPLHTSHPLESNKYVLEDTGSKILITNDRYFNQLSAIADEMSLRLVNVDENNISLVTGLPQISADRKAMILYTSGTTSKPKGVVTTHDNINHQIQSLVEAWRWSEEDHIINILPLHHVHGIINIMSCALWSGACCEFLEEWDPGLIWEKLLSGKVNVFMAVPTIYYKLIRFWEEEMNEKPVKELLKHIRLMVSGSAALPIPVMEQWKSITGHTLLERYGMTEIGMGLSNPYHGERRAGHVGHPLPGVSIQLVDEDGVVDEENKPGEIQVKGSTVFHSYWNKPEATQEAFSDGWFRTGDIADINNGYYRILGRNSVDIIKSGGYKISALEIENILLEHPQVRECAIVGIPDDEWGEMVSCCIIPGSDHPDSATLKEWLRDRLPGYKIPRKYIFRDDLPKNAMGKVSKNEVKKLF